MSLLTTISTSKKTYIQNNNAPGANAGMIYNLTTMEKYDYKEHVSEDVRGYISNHYTREELKSLADDLDELGKKLHDKMWMDDSVTGNRSGSYTCNTWQAEEFLCHNLDLLQEVGFAFLRGFGFE